MQGRKTYDQSSRNPNLIFSIALVMASLVEILRIANRIVLERQRFRSIHVHSILHPPPQKIPPPPADFFAAADARVLDAFVNRKA